jgi:uncharacterized low-complexity protein
MSKMIKPLSVAVGVAFVGTLAISQAASASAFNLSDMDRGYQQVGDEHEHGEGKCGMEKMDTDKSGTISQAEFTAAGKPADKFATVDTDKDGQITQAEMDAHHKAKGEGKCGEGKCGEGKCGDDKEKAEKEGKCGEGKCGGSL